MLGAQLPVLVLVVGAVVALGAIISYRRHRSSRFTGSWFQLVPKTRTEEGARCAISIISGFLKELSNPDHISGLLMGKVPTKVSICLSDSNICDSIN
jgi:hypothetical protein